jgi:hypothetical protein
MDMKKLTVILAALMLVAVLAGCGLGVSVKQDAEGNTVLDVSLPEAIVNGILEGTITTGNSEADTILNQIDSIDMKPGLISVAGKRTLADGTSVNGTFDLFLNVENGDLKASISNVQVAGDAVSQEAINQINERIASALAKSASENAEATFNSVNITDSALQFTVTIQK